MAMQVNAQQAKDFITIAFKSGLVPMLAGSPGLGKSAIYREIAKQFNLLVIDIRLSQCDPTDLMGMPSLDGDKATYRPMDMFPIEGDKVPKGYNGWLVFLDEFNSAPLSVQAAAYKVALDKMVGQQKLHPNAVVACAGNLATDGAIVNRLSTAMQSRLIHLELMNDHEDWLGWASKNKVHHSVTSFINFKPTMLHSFDPNHNDKTFPCPRTWEFCSALMQHIPMEKLTDHLPLLAGTVGEGAAREFMGFCSIFDSLPTIAQIKANPTGTDVPREPGTLFALAGSIGSNLAEANADGVLKYVNRMPVEFQVTALRDAIMRNPKLMRVPAMVEWRKQNASELF